MEETAGRALRQLPHLSAWIRELLLLGICLVAGVVLVPCLLYLVGRMALGGYAHGGMESLFADFASALRAGDAVSWVMALSPYVMLWAVRASVGLIRR